MKKAVLLLLVFFALPALWAQNRYALVIGNNDYVNIQRLANPVNDATDIAAMLRTLGYQVDLQTNLTNVAMARAINDFVNRLALNRDNEGFFWFAGHGVQIDGENYMLPIDVISANEVEARHSSFSVRRLIESLDRVARNKVNIVVLDACRDNPFPNIPGAFRNITRGLGVIQNLPPDLLIIFSTAPDTVAADGTGQRNSPFTQAFLQNMDSHDDIQIVFRSIAQETMRLTNNVQRPFHDGSFLSLTFYSLNPRREQPSSPPVAPPQAAPTPAAMPPVPVSGTGWISVAAGGGNIPGYSVGHTVAVRADGTLWAWGGNCHGQLGDGTIIDRSTPVQIGTAANWASVAIGHFHTLAIKTDGTLWAWGCNFFGQLGDNTRINRSSPVQIGTDTNWASVTTGRWHTVAIRTDGTLWTWGANSHGELGDGTTTNRSTPVRIGIAANWVSVATGRLHTVAVRTDGSLWTWGYNSWGQLGDGTTTNRSTPVRIAAETNWAYVAAGDFHTVAIRTDASLWAWGTHSPVQLDDGTIANPSTPVRIGTDTNWASVATGVSNAHTVAIKTDGSLWAWGDNCSGQLGNGSHTWHHVPVQIGVDTNWASVAAGRSHTVAIRTDGSLWAWGDNEFGQLGNGGGGMGDRSLVPIRVMP